VENIKHQVMLMIIYSAGLRVSEVVQLKPEDIDSQRMLIYIKGAKCRKDRYTLLSHASLNALLQYKKEYNPRKWLFEGAKPDIHISIRTVQKIFENACKRAGIMKKLPFIHYGIVLLLVYWKVGWIYYIFRNCMPCK
jgi:site-specific recombinase XerD